MSGRERVRCLEVLGLPSSADDDDIKKAYRSLARQHHPDKNDGENATEKFQEISYAYKYLLEGPQCDGHLCDNFECGIPIEILIRLFPWLFAGRSMFHEQPRFHHPPSFFMYDSSDDDDCYEFYDMDDSDTDTGCQGQTFSSYYNEKNKNVNAKKERKKEKKRRYEERRRQAKKEAENNAQTPVGPEAGENKKDTKSGFKTEEKDNHFSPDAKESKQQQPADRDQSQQRTAAAAAASKPTGSSTPTKTNPAPKPAKPTEVKKNIAEKIASSSNYSQNQYREKKKKIQAEERRREREIMEIRKELEKQEEIKAKKMAMKKEQEKRAAEERQRKEAEEQERERIELERNEMERREREKKEMERKEEERREQETQLAMEKEEMARQQREADIQAEYTKNIPSNRMDKKVKKTKQTRPVKKLPNGNLFSVLADVDPDDDTLQYTAKHVRHTMPSNDSSMKPNRGASENLKTKNKGHKITSGISMDDLDDISDNEDLLEYVSKSSFWSDLSLGSPVPPKPVNTATKQGTPTKQGNGAKNKGDEKRLPDNETPMQEKKKIQSRVFSSAHYQRGMYGAGIGGRRTEPGGYVPKEQAFNIPQSAGRRTEPGGYVPKEQAFNIPQSAGRRTEPGGYVPKEQAFNIPQAATSNRVQCWADELDDVDDGSIHTDAVNNSNAFKQAGYSYEVGHSISAGNRNNSNSFQGYSGNNRGASQGSRGASQGNRGASPGNRGASQGDRGASAGNRGASAGRGAFQGKRGGSAGYRGNNHSPRGNGASPRGEKVFHNQQQGFYTGGPLQFTNQPGYPNQTFQSRGGRGFPNSGQWGSYAGPPPANLYPPYGQPLPNRFFYF